MIRARITDAPRFWELARLPYNLVLVVATMGGAYSSWSMCPECNRPIMTAHQAAEIATYAVIANALYCVAYAPDLLMRLSSNPQRHYWRGGVWLIGATLSAWLAWICGSVIYIPW